MSFFVGPLSTTSGAVVVSGNVTNFANSGNNIAVATANPGTNWTAFASQACRRLTIVGDASIPILYRQDATGVEITIFAGSYFTIEGITNANQIGIKRVDSSNTPVTINARWEA